MAVDFTVKIERWYHANGRLLPWRNTKDPYKIWISEIILQQTRVAQGLDYYFRFIDAFPDVKTLASASEDQVLRIWQGLGYYSRARNMHKAAQQVMALGGRFPVSYRELRSLCGIGDYTAAAIASFAYGLPYAVLDGNVFRVLSRFYGIETPIDSSDGKKLFATLAQEHLDTSNPGLYNQAIMDFGALQCVPKGVVCDNCPLQEECQAYHSGTVDHYPVKSRTVKVRKRYMVYISVIDELYMSNDRIDSSNNISSHSDIVGHVLLKRRPKGDIWEGLYEWPSFEVDSPKSVGYVLKQSWIERLIENGGQLSLVVKEFKHQLTHQTLIVDAYTLSLPFSLPEWLKKHPEMEFLNSYSCVPITCVSDYAMPRLLLQLLELSE